MRRLVVVLPVLFTVTACSGVDAQRAQQLVQQANTAQQSLSSMTFTANLLVEAKGQEFAVKLKGGGYSRGRNAGDFFLEAELPQIPGLPTTGGKLRVVKRGSSLAARLGSDVVNLPAPPQTVATANPLASFDIARYVKDVKVEGGQVVNGKSVTKIAGVLDTASLLGDAAKLQGYAGGAGQAIPELDGHVGDTRVVAYVDDATHLIVVALADVTAHGDGLDVKIHLDYGLTSYNARVAFPSV